jgi:hypothetical protein
MVTNIQEINIFKRNFFSYMVLKNFFFTWYSIQLGEKIHIQFYFHN